MSAQNREKLSPSLLARKMSALAHFQTFGNQTFQTLVTTKSQFTPESFLVSILKFDTRLRLQQINKKRNRLHSESDKNAIHRIQSDSGFYPSLVRTGLTPSPLDCGRLLWTALYP